jgi:vesicle transport protein SEC22
MLTVARWLTISQKMVLLTFIARVIDGLPLAASMDDSQVSVALVATYPQDLNEYKTQAKMLLKKVSDAEHTRCTIDTPGPCVFQYACTLPEK